jgi:Flp pilus assembly protein TadD
VTTSTPDTPLRRSPWILGWWQDLLLFIATPLAVVPLVSGARLRLSAEEIAIYVAAFGAIGHHLPGMLRAYGDRELFARFRTRFIVAPLFLVATSIFFTHRAPDALAVVVLLWGTWHGLAQVYGFARIYDAKTGPVPWLTARVDLWLCVAWFGAGVLYSPGRMTGILWQFYEAGGPLIAPEAIHAFQVAWGIGTVVTTAAFVSNLVRDWRRGRRASSAKALLFLSSFAFWWYAMVGINHVLLGVALFEIFHDVQYLGIVWVYNRKRVESGHGLGSSMRFLFRRSGTMLGLYVGLVFAYGYGPILAKAVETEAIRGTLVGVFVASTLLHFYFDAFIWSVRDPSTHEGLGIAAEASSAPLRPALASWMPQVFKWCLFVVPLVLLGLAGRDIATSERARSEALVAAFPESGEARARLGTVYLDEDDLDAALREFRQAVRLQPRQAGVFSNIGVVELRRGNWHRAEPPLQRALELDPDSAAANEAMGRVLLFRGDTQAAVDHFRRAVRSEPKFSEAHYDLGAAKLLEGDLFQAASSFRRALEIAPARIGEYANARRAFAQLAEAFAAAGLDAQAREWRSRARGAHSGAPAPGVP